MMWQITKSEVKERTSLKKSTDITKKKKIINNFMIINFKSYREQENVMKETN